MTVTTPYPDLRAKLRGLYVAPILTGDIEADKLANRVADGRAAGVELIAKTLGLTALLEDADDFFELIDVETMLVEIATERGIRDQGDGGRHA